MSSISAQLKQIILLVSGITIYLLKGAPCKSWSLQTFLTVYVLRYSLFVPTKDLIQFRKNLEEVADSKVQNSKLQKVSIHSKFRQQAHELVKDHLKKVYGDDAWYDEVSHWSNAKPLEAEWAIPNHLTLSTNSNVIFYIFGGGYIIGSFGSYRAELERLAQTSDSVAFGASYRLAPDFSSPCQLEDVLAQILYLTSPIDEQNPHESGFGLSFDQIVVSGDSAGGGLSSALIHFMRDSDVGKLAGALLYSPWVDATGSQPSCIECVNTDYLPPLVHITPTKGSTPKTDDIGYSMPYFGSVETIQKAMLKRGHPYAPLKYINSSIVSPLSDTNFRDLPPILMVTGQVELLRDESYLYHELINSSYTDQELKDSNIPPSTLHYYEEMFHVFPMILPDLEASKVSFIRASHFIRQCFSARSDSLEAIQTQYPINTDLTEKETIKSIESKWSNLFVSNLQHQLVPFQPNYMRNPIQTWQKLDF